MVGSRESGQMTEKTQNSRPAGVYQRHAATIKVHEGRWNIRRQERTCLDAVRHALESMIFSSNDTHGNQKTEGGPEPPSI